MSWSVVKASWKRLGSALGAFWVRLGEPGERLWGVLGYRRALWRFEWKQNERFHFASHVLIDFDWNLFPSLIFDHFHIFGPWDKGPWDHGPGTMGKWDHGTRTRDQGQGPGQGTMTREKDQGPGPGTRTWDQEPGTRDQAPGSAWVQKRNRQP